MTTQVEGHKAKTLGLFTRDVAHILEKIFFFLDSNSYKKQVNSTWHELLASDSYRKTKAIHVSAKPNK